MNDEYTFGFAIETSSEDAIESHYTDWRLNWAGRSDVVRVLGQHDWEHPAPTLRDIHWDKLNEDLPRIERNVMEGLRQLFDVVRSEGHSDEELVGTVFWRPSQRKQALGRLGNQTLWPLRLIAECAEAADSYAHFDPAEDLLPAGFDYMEGTSLIAREFVDVRVTLFDFCEPMQSLLEQVA